MRSLLRTLMVFWDSWRNRHVDPPKGYTSQEAEFLSSVMEVEEAPPAPLARVVLWVMALILVAAVAWSYVAKLDIVVEARGKIRPQGEVKVVQAEVYGKVVTANVHEGMQVEAGDTLFELDRSEAVAERDRLQDAMTNVRLMEAGAHLLADSVSDSQLVPLQDLATFGPVRDIRRDLLEDAQRRAAGRRGEMAAQSRSKEAEQESLLALLDTQRRQLEHTKKALLRQSEREGIEMETLSVEITRQVANVELLDEDHEREEALHEKGMISKSALDKVLLAKLDEHRQLEVMRGNLDLKRTDAARERERLEAERDRLENRIAELEADRNRVSRERELLLASFKREMTDEWLAARERRREIELELVKQEEVVSRHTVTAPVAGVVEQLAVHAAGAVVQHSQTLLVVVPADALLQAEVLIENKDVGFLEVGQDVVLKLDAFPHFKHGLMPGELLDIAADALEIEGRGLVYPARIKLNWHEVEIDDGRNVPLAPGMGVTAEVRTGERRLYEFFLEPLLHRRDRALDER